MGDKISDRAMLVAAGWFEDEKTTLRLATEIQNALNDETAKQRECIKNFLGILDTPLGRIKFQSQFVKDVIEQAKKINP